ncbi:glycoside hydrolase family 28 protein [Gallaecimonas xiamenensis]|uniref:Polygalacturonase n=1 Tax=Gallaecimonas xiamenensis 3-C-1 TaxID=745411 RepID=K2J263_9GAMM|nr:glycoside hydrolase family 28 protein [Gallaecimonas xiamenensis]EKE68937.1 polygalacturonase [Gallaecimonas xiamenensis 3-C-1]
MTAFFNESATGGKAADPSLERRTLLKALGAGLVLSQLPACASAPKTQAPADDWALADDIVRNTQLPKFAERDFPISDFGAVPGGKVLNSDAIAAAIAACAAAGGGRVRVPQGRFLTGAIHLKSNVNLHLDKGAVLVFSPNPDHYLPAVFTRWEGMEMMGLSPLIYAYGQRNIAVTGQGVLDGGADDNTWWPWKGPHPEGHWRQDPIAQTQKAARDKLQQEVLAGTDPRTRLHGQGSFLRPAFIQPYLCQNVLIEGVTLVNSPFWLLHPVLCQSVTVRGVTCRSHGPNNDGCDPECCDHVVIEGCTFDTGDDCIAIKSGRNEDGRRVGQACRNLVVRNCQMKDGHGGLVLGSEISGGVYNVFLDNCQMDSPELERAFRIKTNARRGGTIEGIRIRNLRVGEVKDAVSINFFYEEGQEGRFLPEVRDIHIDNLVVRSAQRAFYLRGFASAPIEGVTLSNCRIDKVAAPSVLENVGKLELNNVRVAGKLVSATELEAL